MIYVLPIHKRTSVLRTAHGQLVSKLLCNLIINLLRRLLVWPVGNAAALIPLVKLVLDEALCRVDPAGITIMRIPLVCCNCRVKITVLYKKALYG